MDNLKRENLPSRFLKLIDENLIDFKNIKQKDLKSKIELYFGKKEEKVLSIFNKEFIKKTFLENPLSFTALNNYLKSPIVYFFRNLIRLPSVQVNYLVFGNIIHKTLELYFEKGKNEKRKPEKKELLLFFDQALEMFKINEKDFKNFKNRGYELLEKYFDKYNKDFNFDIRLEKDFYSEIELKDGAKLKLYGIVDKIEKLDDNKIRVIDYKTGKTYREKTKEGRENLERQLVFYRLLIDGYFNDDRVSEAVLDFVEENKKTGELEVFKKIIDKKDVEELKELIREFAEDILSGDFLEREYEKTKENKEYFEL
ncbi:MAG: PD-(D/E)XK nuclease family protein [Candidatus Pacebacteria bacterium]|nr:PD-(D/E)XK nuclease family protein [Candidatus Paceibacterota bacterium]